MTNAVKNTLIASAFIIGLFGLIGGYKYINAQQKDTPSTSPSVSTDPSATPYTLTTPSQSVSPTPQATHGCIPASYAANSIGKSTCVQMYVGYTFVSSRCNAYLDVSTNYTGQFSAWIPDGCGLGETLTSQYANKTVDVAGTITWYEGAPEIQVTSASQVSLAN